MKIGASDLERAWAWMIRQGMSHAGDTTGFAIDRGLQNGAMTEAWAAQRAWAYIVIQGMAHGSNSGLAIEKDDSRDQLSGSRPVNWSIQRGTAGFDKDAQWGRKRNLRAAAHRLNEVVLECDDAIKCVERWDTKTAIIYGDPPYPGSDQGPYSGYTLEDLQRFVDCCESAQASILLSNYDQPALKIPDHWERFEKEVTLMAAKRSGASREKRIEVVWRKLNSSATKQRTLFDNLYERGLK